MWALTSWCARLGRLQRLRTVKLAARPPVLAHQLASAYVMSSADCGFSEPHFAGFVEFGYPESDESPCQERMVHHARKN